MALTTLLLSLLLFAEPFWATKSPQDWTQEDMADLVSRSPWAQMVPGPGKLGNFPPVQVILATAGPIRQAEEEARRRAELARPPTPPGREARPAPDPFAEEYRLWLEEFAPTQIILAIQVSDTVAYNDADEVEHLEKECVMRVGRKKIQMTGYFPPTVTDPYLRIAFPRQVTLKDKKVKFELYIPGISGPYRDAEFELEPMVVNGKLEL